MNYSLDVIEIAHRGDSDKHKDNTVDAFVSALNNGFDMLELDIQMCKSGEIIVFHDTEIDNDKMIINLTFSEILKIDPDVITLDEFFNIPGVKDVKVYLDLKGCNDLSNEIVKFINDKRLNTDNILIASYNLKHLTKINELNERLSLGFITENNFTNDVYQKIIGNDAIKTFVIHWTALDDDSIQFLKFYGVKIYTYTCKDDIIYKNMIKYNIDGIVTNYKIGGLSLL